MRTFSTVLTFFLAFGFTLNLPAADSKSLGYVIYKKPTPTDQGKAERIKSISEKDSFLSIVTQSKYVVVIRLEAKNQKNFLNRLNLGDTVDVSKCASDIESPDPSDPYKAVQKRYVTRFKCNPKSNVDLISDIDSKISHYSLVNYSNNPFTRYEKITSSPISPGCFAEGALVDTPRGPIPIQNLKKGDEVYSYNEQEKKIVSSRVTNTMTFDDREIYELRTSVSEESIYVTGEHPFYLPEKGKYVQVQSLLDNDALFCRLPKREESPRTCVINIKNTGKKAKVYNITVDPEHNYFVNGILVHNKET